MITISLERIINEKTGKGKAIIIKGARQVGKTTLLKKIFGNNPDVLWLNGDEKDTQDIIQNSSSTRLKAYFGNKTTVIIDEAQRIQDIGIRMKIITD